jgi:hypothetical protein
MNKAGVGISVGTHCIDGLLSFDKSFAGLVPADENSPREFPERDTFISVLRLQLFALWSMSPRGQGSRTSHGLVSLNGPNGNVMALRCELLLDHIT